MGIKKGDKRNWDIYKNKKVIYNKNVNFRVSEEDLNDLKELRKKGYTYRDIMFLGILKLKGSD